ncbi:MAG: substrate-binding domain-containing protein [Hominilimicola sp.]
MKTRNLIAGLLTGVLAASALAGCGGNTATTSSTSSGSTSGSSFKADSEITVVSRENGSGTRGAFIELMGIEEKGADGTKVDKTTSEAVIANKTDVMLTNVSGDEYGIGYVSLGSLSSSVKAIKVDGVEATPENVKNGTYKVSRPFNIATKAEISDVAQDFIDFILSSEGQEIVSDGYIKVNDDAQPYAGTKPAGKIVVAGSSSVSPVMEKLKEAYLAVNTNAEIELQTSDSTAGMTGAIEGTCDIGMASRDLKDSEKETLTSTAIALDGIAIIVNPVNPIDDITSEQVKDIFTGTKTTWSEIA